MINKDKAKEQIKVLVKKYEELSSSGKISSYKEERTKNELIEPLFEALGWDMRNQTVEDEVIKEQKVLRKKADYAFRLTGVIRFFVEAKAAKVDLESIEFAKQAISYGFNTGVTWAVLTNFEGLKVFNCEWDEKNIWRNQVFALNYTQYLTDFEKLWFFSKDSFLQNGLTSYAATIGKRTPRKSVSALLLSQLLIWRQKLSAEIKKIKPSYSQEDIDETVQRLIDRLIFIRACEDREIEQGMLWEALRNKEKSISLTLKKIFAHYRTYYDSKLFGIKEDDIHEVDVIRIDDNILEGVIETLYYSKDSNIRYDFSIIDADILGNVYEQYLGTILKTTAKRAKLEGGKVHRKEQGIYYTPTYIVDYIVKNTLGEILKNKKLSEIDKIKILDPACGSGSFLLKAFDILDDYYAKHDKDYGQHKLSSDGFRITKKIEILKNNIHGVDLDEKAVEIAQLNLLLKMAEKRHLLPSLEKNIQLGNSLIDDNTVDKKAFKWEERFKEIMGKDRFDVVIGNPPYVEARQIEQNYVDYYRGNYKTAGNRVNTFPLFIEKSINLLKEGGLFGMIVHKNSIRSNDYEKLRNVVLNSCKISKIIPLGAGVFEGVTGEVVILIFQKCSDIRQRKKNIVVHGEREVITNGQQNYKRLPQEIFYEIPGNRFNVHLDENKIKILDKIKKGSVELKEIAETKQGIIVGDEKKYIKSRKESSKYVPILRGRNVARYNLKFNNEFLYYVPGTKVLTRGKTPDLFEKDEKIVTQHVSGRIIAALDTNQYYTLQTINLIYSKGRNSNKYLLSLLNSKVLNFYYDSYFNMGSEFTTAVATENLDLLPIKIISESQQQPIIKPVDRMLSLNKQLQSLGNKKTAQTAKLEEEIKKTDHEIDELVYKLYNITEEEKKIIEESLK